MECLMYYFAYIDVYNSLYYNEWGKYFVIASTDNGFENNFMLNKYYVVESILYGNTFNVYNLNPFSIINGLIYATDYKCMSHLVDLSINKSYS